TSMAAPVVCGVAALVWAYHPELTALELKNLLIDSSMKLPKKKVILPGTKKDKVRLIEISKTAGLVNTYN
ncbi:MAG: S8 family serine peptidase, partial [Salibacteraceae bacterium]|nr:S8 family serine peptidase [Salibacteraceae bacterium]